MFVNHYKKGSFEPCDLIFKPSGGFEPSISELQSRRLPLSYEGILKPN